MYSLVAYVESVIVERSGDLATKDLFQSFSHTLRPPIFLSHGEKRLRYQAFRNQRETVTILTVCNINSYAYKAREADVVCVGAH